MLDNIKDGMGKLLHAKGNPLSKAEITFNIDILNFGALDREPTSYPVYLFGLTDFYGGYAKSSLVNPINPAWRPVQNSIPFGIVGYSANLAIAGLIAQVQNGDMIEQFQNVVLNNRQTVIRTRCQNIAYGTFLNSFVSDLITVSKIRIIVPIANINQFTNPLIFGYQTLFGKTYTDTIDPRMFIVSTDFQQQICDIPIDLPIDKAMFLTYNQMFDCRSIQIILFVSKIEPLTHK